MKLVLRLVLRLAPLALLLGLASCSPYRVVRASGVPITGGPIGVAFDYSEARFRHGRTLESWLAERNAEELAAYQLCQRSWEAAFVADLGARTGMAIVPATGAEPITLSVAVQHFEMGRWAPFATVDTFLEAAMRFQRGGQVTDEILVAGFVDATQWSLAEDRMSAAGHQIAADTSLFLGGR
jgi:hypothetical protein